MNPTEKYYDEYFKIIGKEGCKMSIFDFYVVVRRVTHNFKKEINRILEYKDSDSARLFYISGIKLKFKEFVPPDNNIGGYFLNYKKLCDYWCKKYDCENKPQIFQTFSSKLTPVFVTNPVDFKDKLADFSKAKIIRENFLDFLRFGAMKEIYEILDLYEETIRVTFPVQFSPKIEGPTYYTDKTLSFIQIQFEAQINENSLTGFHIIHSNYPFLDWDIARNEIKSYLKDKDNASISKLKDLSKHNIEMYISTIQNFTGDELGVKVFNVNTQKDQYIKRENYEHRYKLREHEIKYVLADNFDYQPLQLDEKEYRFENFHFFVYCKEVYNFIEENFIQVSQQLTPVNNSEINQINNMQFLEDKDYLNILLMGYKNNETFLSEHIYRESLNAKNKNIGPNEFFSRCYNIIDMLNHLVDIAFTDRKNEIISIYNRAKNKKIVFPDDYPDITYDKRCLDYMKDCEEELKVLDHTQFSANIRTILKTEFNKFISFQEIQSFKEAIDQAFILYQNNNQISNNAIVNSDEKINHNPVIQINENESEINTINDNWTVSVFALFLYFLKEGGYIENISLKFLQPLCDKYKYSKGTLNLNNTICAIKKNTEKDPVTKPNMLNVIKLLEGHRRSEKIATKVLSEWLP
ncbi:MAG: hypothetical protein ACOYMA_03700 [Bacteroidia bacterium]